MTIQIALNDESYIQAISQGGKLNEGIDITQEQFEQFDLDNLNCYKYIDENTITFDENKKLEQEQESILADLRNQRESTCFAIVNRGRVWYDTLTDEQITELAAWYDDWLDVTESLIVPVTPSFIN